VKANLARFTWAVVIIASMAMTLGAGIRWNEFSLSLPWM
jgi:hypothetical protein